MAEQTVDAPLQAQDLVRQAQLELQGWEILELCSEICDKRSQIAELMVKMPTSVLAMAAVSYEAFQASPKTEDETSDPNKRDGGDPILELISIIDRHIGRPLHEGLDFAEARFEAERALAAAHGKEDVLSPWIEKKNRPEVRED